MTLFHSILMGDLPLCDAIIVFNIIMRKVLSSIIDFDLDIGLIHIYLKYSKVALIILIGISLSGHVFLWNFYKHNVTTVFNATLPPIGSKAHLNSYFEFYKLVRPLEIGWRYLTVSYRVLPDILVLGEVRCGTTTMCAHLKGMGSTAPFCPWKHPELDKKETFYFAAHYLGSVNPANYALCFPLKPHLTYWPRYIINKLFPPLHDISEDSFFTFDGCAQYLTSPTAPTLIAEAYLLRGLPPPVLVACVRDPVQQAVSWWKYENAAMQWGKSMGLDNTKSELRGHQYPPPNIIEALKLSQARSTTVSYIAAEKLFSTYLTTTSDESSADSDPFDDMYQSMVNQSSPHKVSLSSKKDQSNKKRNHQKNSYGDLSVEDKVWVNGLLSISTKDNNSSSFHMPSWAGVWPGGQLAAIGRNGRYSENIQRFESHFHKMFNKMLKKEDVNIKSVDIGSHKLRYVNIVDLSQLSNNDKLKTILTKLAKKMNERKEFIIKKKIKSSFGIGCNLDQYFNTFTSSMKKTPTMLVRNAAPNVDVSLEPSEHDIQLLTTYFKGEKEKLMSLSGATIDSFPWKYSE